MLKQQLARWALHLLSSSSSPGVLPVLLNSNSTSLGSSSSVNFANIDKASKLRSYPPRPSISVRCRARRRLRYEDDGEEEDDEEYGQNKEIATLEYYSRSARGEALLVHAILDEQQVEVLIFKGFSSSLSHGTSPDPSKSVLPARAVIKSIDRIKGPFDPSNIQFIEKGIKWEAFKTRLVPT